jgi:DNA-binding NarL/FixJ family response regulator
VDRLRILLVDDHDLFRKGIARLIDSQPDFQVVGEAQDGREALEKARALEPDVILMDIEMPQWNGVEATRRIKAEKPGIDVVMLTVSDEDDNLFAAIRAGASGYLLKSVKPEELFRRLRGVSRGDQSPPLPKSIEGLSPRETEVLGLVAKGLTNREIGEQLHIAENTVKNHLRNILDKLHLNNRAQAAAFAVRHGLIKGK